jgi:4-amino-4-deoxy-L-arabinose transferase-like glycosyltransferase
MGGPGQIERVEPPVDLEADPPGEDRSHRRFFAFIVGLLGVSLWIWPIRASLWIDELGTWWVVKDSFASALDRAFTYHGQSPVYYSVVWVVGRLGGRSEALLRLPSVFAGVLAALLFFRLLRRLADDETARLGLVAFVGLGGISFAVTDARPYGFGLLALVASTLALVRWLDEGRRADAAAYLALAILTIWVHYMFALALPAQLLYAAARVRAGSTRVRARDLIAAVLIIAVGVIPLAAQILSLWDRRGSLAVANVATLEDLIIAMVPPVVVGAFGVGVLLARSQGSLRYRAATTRPFTLLLLTGWLMIPPLALFALSMLADQMFLAARYYVCAAPAVAGLFAVATRGLGPASARRIVVVAFALLTTLMTGGLLKNAEDWRSAALAERTLADDSTVVLLHPALVESSQVGWFDDPERRSYLMSPTSFYDFEGEIIPLPYMLTPVAERYLAELTSERLAGLDRFLIVTNYSQVPISTWLEGRLGDDGWTARVAGTFGAIEVIEFSKVAAAP